MSRSTFMTLGVSLGILFASASTAQAKLPFVKKAQEMGFKEITACTSCHTMKMPTKAKHDFTPRGQFLFDAKKSHKVEEVDLAWLKDFKGKA